MTPASNSIEVLFANLAHPGKHPLDDNALIRHQEELLAQAQTQGIAPLAYHNLQKTGQLNLLKPNVRTIFEQAFYRTLASNLVSLQALRELAQELGPREIPAIVLKGPALIELVYKHPALRPMTDIDLLVRPADLARLGSVLRSMGYQHVHLYPELFQRGSTVLDLHTDPINQSRITSRGQAVQFTPACLWRNSVPLPGFTPLRMLDLPDQILTLSVHALKHGFQQDIWLVDIARCLEQVEDWQAFYDRAHKTRTTHILELVFWMLRQRLCLNLPKKKRSLTPAYRPGILERLLLETASQPGTPQLLEPLFFYRAIPGLSEKVRYLLEFAFPQPHILHQITGL
ncbi:MAG: nucleotidyltransferase family protein, partial [bacterium]|nr:nucleotidyltransferase family protein [bacterium]